MRQENLEEKFGQLIIEARNSGLMSLKNQWLKGWKPKTPNADHIEILRFLGTLDDEEKDLLLHTIKFFLDMSFFKLMSIIENGESQYQLEVKIKDCDDGQELILGGNDIHVIFWEWVEKYGLI